jgi:hypothetical protein
VTTNRILKIAALIYIAQAVMGVTMGFMLPFLRYFGIL